MSQRWLDPAAFDYQEAQHLLNRAGFGGTPDQIQALVSLGLDAAVDYLLEYQRIDDAPLGMDRFNKDFMRPVSPQEQQQMQRAWQGRDQKALEMYREQRQKAQQSDWAQMRELQAWWLSRMIETPCPLAERMTLFWHGHFATSYRGVEDSYHMFMQNQLFRRHAAGDFKALVHGIIRDPAMLRSLNNDQNHKTHPNENLARELMELFTLGEGPAYTENDVKEGARALTGYTFVDDEFIDMESTRYQQLHDDEPKRILGRSGDWNGDDFVDLIFDQGSVGEFICGKLYRFLVNDRPGPLDESRQQYVLDLASQFRMCHYMLKPVLKTLFMSEHFYDPSNVGTLIKSPVQLIVQASRTLGTPPRSPSALVSAADLMGQHLYYPPTVKGWGGGRGWINTSSLLIRQNAMVYLLTGRRPNGYPWPEDGAPYDATHLIEHLRGRGGRVDARDAVTHLLRINLAGPPHEERVEELIAFVRQGGGRLDNPAVIALLSLITSMPEYQLC